MRHIKTLLVLTILAIAVMSGVTSNRNPTLAADFSCTTATCPGIAQCSGDRFSQSGCEKTCYRDTGVPGQIVFNGSANCSPPSTGGSGGGGSGSGSEGGYCAENWWWDFNCSGPDDPYEPWIN